MMWTLRGRLDKGEVAHSGPLPPSNPPPSLPAKLPVCFMSVADPAREFAAPDKATFEAGCLQAVHIQETSCLLQPLGPSMCIHGGGIRAVTMRMTARAAN